MHRQRRMNDAVNIYMSGIQAKVVAQSGIPSDRYHLGKLILQGLKDSPEDFIAQIDAAEENFETCKSMLERSVRCASAFRKMGVGVGDVLIFMTATHLDVAIPYYAALYLGATIAVIDKNSTPLELPTIFKTDKPKIVFCQGEKVSDVSNVINNLQLDSYMVCFDNDLKLPKNVLYFSELLENYDNGCSVGNFRATDFNPEETVAFLIATSETTGLPKQAVATYKAVSISGPYLWARYSKFPTPMRMAMIVSALQWGTALMHFNLSPILRYTRLQSSAVMTQDHAYDVINKYKPTFMIISPTLWATLMRPGDRDRCDFTCLDEIYIGGSAVSRQLLAEVKKASPNTLAFDGYGMSELTNFVFSPVAKPFGTVGIRFGYIDYRLVDPETLEDIIEPNVVGELWVTGPSLVKGYHGNPEDTKAAFRPDGWFRTGDLFYRDENYHFFFVDKLKLLLKYKNHQVSPNEVENVIRQLPGVADVCVLGIPELECGELIAACVVKKPNYDVTAQEVQDIVKCNLVDTKHLRGGVLFLNEFPTSSVGKIDRQKLKKILIASVRE